MLNQAIGYGIENRKLDLTTALLKLERRGRTHITETILQPTRFKIAALLGHDMTLRTLLGQELDLVFQQEENLTDLAVGVLDLETHNSEVIAYTITRMLCNAEVFREAQDKFREKK